jgi:hypothetical protein
MTFRELFPNALRMPDWDELIVGGERYQEAAGAYFSILVKSQPVSSD